VRARLLLALVSALLLAPPGESDSLETILTFEASEEGALKEWEGGPAATLSPDSQIVHGGKWSARIERDAASEREFSAINKWIPMDFAGAHIELRGFLRTQDVTGWAGLWMREDGEAGPVAFDNMQDRAVRGSTEWTEYSIKLPLSSDARKVYFGALLAGQGKVWVDDLQLLVDGKPVSEAPRLERPRTVLDTDREFDLGSRVEVGALSATQVASLGTLAKVWGFLKYHHPRVTAGHLHWDYELFRILPGVLAAPDRESANSILLAWVKKLGDVAPCAPCASAPDDVHLRSDLEWLRDRQTLGEELSGALEWVFRNRDPAGGQFYVSLHPRIGNPDFTRERGYAEQRSPDAGYRLLTLFRFWNIIQYWFPYRDAIDEDWHAVLSEFVPRMAAAKDFDTYQLELLALIARVKDGHANLWSSLDVRPPRGKCHLPVRLRFIEEKAVVVGYTHSEEGPACGLKVGDAIASLDGTAVEALVQSWSPYYAASNDSARRRDIARFLTRGECKEVVVKGRRADGEFELAAKRQPAEGLDLAGGSTHDLLGDAFRLLSDEVAYLKLSAVKGAEVLDYVRGAQGTRGWVIDIRNYPSDFMVFALGQHLVAETTRFVQFTRGDLINPGTFLWREALSLEPVEPHYEGKVVILVDELSQSSAEYTAMAFRSASGATVVGSTTAGADGNVSALALPGGLRTMISGIGVFYPDRQPTQRIGIVPEVKARPTIEGIRQRRDEVLEVALRRILGDGVPEDHIRSMARGERAAAAKPGEPAVQGK